LPDVEGIFTVRTSVAENHLSRKKMREMGIAENTVSNMIKEGRCAWVATDDDEVVGFSMILREKGSIYGLFVLPAYEGRGIGRRLTKIAEQELSIITKLPGWKQIKTAVRPISICNSAGIIRQH